MSVVGDYLSTEAGGNAIGSAINSLFGTIGQAFGDKAERDLARENANNSKYLIDKQLELAKINQETELAKAQGRIPVANSKLPLYIGIGVGSVLVIGLVIFAVTRNK